MFRWSLVFVLPVAASAADYRFVPDQVMTYLVETRQTVAWNSAGDELKFVTSLATNQAWHCISVERDLARIETTILNVSASHQGPGANHRLDSRQQIGFDDPLLGHFAVLEGKTLRLSVNIHTGATIVTGGDAIIAAIAKRAPNHVDPTGPSPLLAQAQALYGDATLTRTWSQSLALPSATPSELPLAAPLSGTLLRTWSGDAWTLSGEIAGTAVLAKEPTAVTALVSDASGLGRMILDPDGWPKVARGKLEFSLAITALTQPVRQRHTIEWQLARTGP